MPADRRQPAARALQPTGWRSSGPIRRSARSTCRPEEGREPLCLAVAARNEHACLAVPRDRRPTCLALVRRDPRRLRGNARTPTCCAARRRVSEICSRCELRRPSSPPFRGAGGPAGAARRRRRRRAAEHLGARSCAPSRWPSAGSSRVRGKKTTTDEPRQRERSSGPPATCRRPAAAPTSRSGSAARRGRRDGHRAPRAQRARRRASSSYRAWPGTGRFAWTPIYPPAARLATS